MKIFLRIALLFSFLIPSIAHATLPVSDPIEPDYYGAACDGGNTDDTSVFDNTIIPLMHLTGHCVKFRNVCKYHNQFIYDTNSNSVGEGVCILGTVGQLSGLSLTTTTSPAFQIKNSSGTSSASPAPIVGMRLEDFGLSVSSSLAGPAVDLGQTNYFDAINSSIVKGLIVSNPNTSSSCGGIEVNFVLNTPFINNIVNCGGLTHGYAYKLRKAQFDTFVGGSGGNSGKGVWITDDNSFGNDFIGFDNDGNTSGYVIDSSQAHTNTVHGGQLSWDNTTGYGVDASAGTSNRFENVAFGPNTHQINGSTGICFNGGTNLPGSYTACSSGTGTLTSAGFTGDGVVFNSSVTGSPITTSGSFAPSLHTQSANGILAGPTTGAATAPTFRSLVAADLPLATTGAFGAVKPDGTTVTISAGIISSTGGGGSGTVSSGSAYQLAQYQATGATVAPISVTNCADIGGNHLNFNSSTGVFSCGTTSSGGGGGTTGALLNIQSFLASGTYTPTSGMASAIVYMCAGGGGGGGAAQVGSSSSNAGGGGAGSCVEVSETSAQIGTSQPVVIGAAGTAGAAGNNNGSTGGATQLGTSGALISCPGGNGGIGSGGHSGISPDSAGGSPATACTVTTGTSIQTIQGGPGNPGIALSGVLGISGKGADSSFGWGNGGQQAMSFGGSNGTSHAGTGYASGGGGASVITTPSLAGAAGTTGYMIIYEYR